MAIETAYYLSDLNVSNPPGSDPVGQADDHIRLLKAVLKYTFPNINAAITSTPIQLNGYLVPQGGIMMWSGSTSALPSGWALCDGGSYPKADGSSGNITTPDLRNKFILASGASTGLPNQASAVGSVGGQPTVTPAITVTNQPVSLTEAQLPAHTHTSNVSETPHTHTATQAEHKHTVGISSGNSPSSVFGTGTMYSGGTINTSSVTPAITVASATTGITVTNNSTGSGATHVHNNTAVSSTVETIPPYYTLAFIMKL